MSFTNPYRQHNFIGEFSSDSAVLTFIQACKWDSAGNGTGDPRSGMMYYNTSSTSFKVYTGSSWQGVTLDSHDHNGGDGAAITEAAFSFTNITTANATASAHGLLPILSGSTSQWLRGDGTWTSVSATATPGGSNHQVQFNNNSTLDGAANLYWDHSNDRLGIGTATPAGHIDIRSDSQAHLIGLTGSASNATLFGMYRARGTSIAPTAIQSGDEIGWLYFAGYGTSTWISSAASIRGIAREAFTNSTSGTDIAFYACPVGTTTSAEVARFNGNGLTIGPSAHPVSWPLTIWRNNGISEVANIVSSATAAHGAWYYVGHTRGTGTVPTATQSGDVLGSYAAIGYGTSIWTVPAYIQFTATQAHTNSAAGTQMSFFTTNDGAVAATERVRITQAGYVGIGTINPLFELHVASTDYSEIAAISHSATPATAGLYYAGHTRGTNATPTATQSGDTLGYYSFMGYAASYVCTAYMAATANQTFTVGAQGTNLLFSTVADGTTTVTERMRITSDGRVSIGSTTGAATLGGTSYTVPLYVASTGSGNYIGGIHNEGAGTSPIFRGLMANGSLSSKTVVVNNNVLTGIQGWGYDGTNYAYSSGIHCEVDGTPGNNDMPGRIVFATAADGTESPVERMRITSAGILQVGLVTGATGQINLVGTTSGVVGLKVADTAGTWTMTLPATAGTDGYFLKTNGSGVTSWAAVSSGMSDPMTTRGDIIYRNASNVTARLALGSNGQVLKSNGSDLIWGTDSTGAGGVTLSKSFMISGPTSDSDGAIWHVPVNITITNIHVLCVGGTNIVGQLWEYDANGSNGSTVDSDITATAGTNTDDDGTISNPGITAGNYLGWKTTSISGTPTKVIVTFEYTED